MAVRILQRTEPWQYGIIFDAGSSGTRLHIYRWLESDYARKSASLKQLHALPTVETKSKWTKKTRPGLSTFGQKPNRVGPDHLEELFHKAQEVIPNHLAPQTPVFLLATAGMRLLPKSEQDRLLQEICIYIRSSTSFLLPDCDAHIRVIPGEHEGLYGWIATNYLLGGFDAPTTRAGQHNTSGFLDLGGASAQIAFAPNATESERHANDLKLMRIRTLDGKAFEYRVFTTTWMGFGVNEARRRYVESLEEDSRTLDTPVLQDPCLPVGLTTTVKGDVLLPESGTIKIPNSYLNGTGQFDTCLAKTLPLLEKNHSCEDEPCPLMGVHVPPFDFDVNHFVGVSEYWHITHDIFQEGHKDKVYDFYTYQKRVNDFCSQNWKVIHKGVDKHRWGKKVNEQTVVEVCFKASWLINILHEGIGIPRYGIEDVSVSSYNGTKKILESAKEKGHIAAFQPVNKIDDIEVGWALGKMLLYASSEVAPLGDNTLPVGFGSNVPGIPDDFQYAGSKSGLNSSSKSAGVDLEFAESNMFRSSSYHRIPGFVLLLLIFAMAVYLLCGCRLRPQWVLRLAPPIRKVSGQPPRGQRELFGSRLPFLRSRSRRRVYERILEEGALSNNHELGFLDDINDEQETSDSSSSSRNANQNINSAVPRSRSGVAINESWIGRR